MGPRGPGLVPQGLGGWLSQHPEIEKLARADAGGITTPPLDKATQNETKHTSIRIRRVRAESLAHKTDLIFLEI